jgi:lipopolysaccharide transport system ATP-binding protein
MNPAIRVENLSKLYRIGAQQRNGYRTLRESLNEASTAPWRWLNRFARGAREDAGISRRPKDTFWAVDDISFDVDPGEVIGIIGRNGAGKSTLLKIISRITEPTEGRVVLHGRIGSLLEVGTGFHHELTGRENVFLSGSILGMSRREITRKFDEIVAFSEIGPFLDTPVKRYSSGMYIRLAFAVASYLEPEILVIDEVLAVGDAAFQKKCLAKIGEVGRSGRTVLFVSHNMAAIQNLCERIVYLERGKLVFAGACEEGIKHYTSRSSSLEGADVDLSTHPGRRVGSSPVLRRLRLMNGLSLTTDQFLCGEPMVIELIIEDHSSNAELNIAVVYEDPLGGRLFTLGTHLSDTGAILAEGTKRVICFLDELPIAPGRYCLSLEAIPPREEPIDSIDQAVWFDVNPTDYYGSGRSPHVARGRFVARSRWHVQEMAHDQIKD